jgi:hypothetical protein
VNIDEGCAGLILHKQKTPLRIGIRNHRFKLDRVRISGFGFTQAENVLHRAQGRPATGEIARLRQSETWKENENRGTAQCRGTQAPPLSCGTLCLHAHIRNRLSQSIRSAAPIYAVFLPRLIQGISDWAREVRCFEVKWISKRVFSPSACHISRSRLILPQSAPAANCAPDGSALSRDIHYDAQFAHNKPFQGGFALQLLYNAKNNQTVQTAKPIRLLFLLSAKVIGPGILTRWESPSPAGIRFSQIVVSPI